MKILIGGTKGGSGKSTAVMNLAAYMASQGLRVIIMDTDPQGSCAKFVERRENTDINVKQLAKIHCVQNSGNVYQSVLDLDKLYDIVLIDAGGHDSRELRTAMVAADHLYVPLQASQLDLETLTSLTEMIVMAMDQNPTLKVHGLLSRASSSPFNNEAQEARELFEQFPLFKLSRTLIRDRKVYRDVLVVGKGVVEHTNSKAKAEIQLLGQEILNEFK
jgi:chromosome partitioning protein